MYRYITAQFLVHADARVRQVFPRLSWGPEVVHVTGEHLAPGGGHAGGGIDGTAMLDGGMAPWGGALHVGIQLTHNP